MIVFHILDGIAVFGPKFFVFYCKYFLLYVKDVLSKTLGKGK